MKAGFVAWLACLAIAPRPVARRLAAVFVFPARRVRLNAWLRRMGRR
jgi:hypothetical protein